MTLEQLRIFVAVAERAHLTQAAEALHLSASAVSAAIRTLEARYASPLFNRVGRGLEVTPVGRSFLPHARAVLAAAAAAEQVLTETSGLKRGRLGVQASQTIAGYWVPGVLMAFQRAYPGIAVTLEIGNTSTVAAAILEGAADIGFIEGEIEAPALYQRQVAEDRLIVVVSRQHKWADGHPLGPEELSGARWVLREPGSGTRSVFEAGLRTLGTDPTRLDVAITLPSNEAVLSAIEGNEVAGAMSERVAHAAIAAGRLAGANFILPPRAFTLLRHKERFRSPAAKAFEALLPVMASRRGRG